MALYNFVLLLSLLFGSENWVKIQKVIKCSGNRVLKSLCDKTRKRWAKNEWMLNGCGLSREVSDRYEGSALRWPENTNRINVEWTEKQVQDKWINQEKWENRVSYDWMGFMRSSMTEIISLRAPWLLSCRRFITQTR